MKRLLIVEDDPHCGAAVRDHLAELGYEVRWVRDGVDALAEVRRSSPDLVILDLFLPRLDGFSVLRLLRAQQPSPKVIVLSAAGAAGDPVANLPPEVRPDRSIGKPAPLGQLADEVGALVGRPTHPPPPLPTERLSFPELLISLRDQSVTGRVILQAEGVLTHVYVLNGSPVFAEHGTLGKSLGRLLLDEGKLSEEQYGQAIRRMAEEVRQDQQKRLGEVLLELGFLRPNELFAALQRQVREKLLACFQWDPLEHSVEHGIRVLEDVAMLECQAVEPLLVEGIRRYCPEERVWTALDPIRDRHVRLLLSPAEVVSIYGLSPDDADLVGKLDGTRTVAQVCAESSLGTERAAQLLWALRMGRAIDDGAGPLPEPEPVQRETRRQTVPPPSASPSSLPEPIAAEYVRVRGASPARVLGIAGELSPETVQRAYDGALARVRSGMIELRSPAPEVYQRSGEILGRLESARAHLLDAIRVARTPKGPACLGAAGRSEKAARLTAEEAYREGKRLLKARMLRGAIEELERAAKLEPTTLEYELVLSWARFLAAGDAASGQAAMTTARLVALRALKQDQGLARAHAILGHVFNREGDDAKAARHLRLAVQHDPDDLEAQAELRLLESRGSR